MASLTAKEDKTWKDQLDDWEYIKKTVKVQHLDRRIWCPFDAKMTVWVFRSDEYPAVYRCVRCIRKEKGDLN